MSTMADDLLEAVFVSDDDVSDMESIESVEFSGKTVEKSVIWRGRGTNKQVVEVEVVLKEDSMISRTRLEKMVDSFLRRQGCLGSVLMNEFGGTALEEHVETIEICLEDPIDLKNFNLKYFVFKLVTEGPEVEDISDTAGEEIPAATTWMLPTAEMQGVWNSLVFDTNVKSELLKYVQTSIFLVEEKVDPNLVGVNKVVLLHGPPGTGKTSLCRALANKLAIRMGGRFKRGLLIEINSHSLFSKWFSESGKLVQRMFDEIKRKVADEDNFVCVLIDEVESLTSARKNSQSGMECSDAVRVVNALLTQIDSIKQLPNVLILTTSNITGSIDLAFVDRADIKQYVGPPTQTAIYQIYLSAIQELTDKGVLSSKHSIHSSTVLKSTKMITNQKLSPSMVLSLTLWRIAELSCGFSGRTLRKIPFLALANTSELMTGMEASQFLESMRVAVVRQTKEREELNKSQNTA